MIESKISRLGPKLFVERSLGNEVQNQCIEIPFSTPPVYIDIIREIGGAIVFANGARYKPDTANPLTKADGYNSLEILYGLGEGENSLHYKLQQYRSELPVLFFPIGEGPGGNLIFVDNMSAVFLWDHESPVGSNFWQIAISLEHFMNKLEPDDSALDGPDGVIESESFLDF